MDGGREGERDGGREGGRERERKLIHCNFNGCYVQSSMELGPEDVSLLERYPHFRGCYVQSSMELGPYLSLSAIL